MVLKVSGRKRDGFDVSLGGSKWSLADSIIKALIRHLTLCVTGSSSNKSLMN